jgi:NADH-ubiquinone oxidoreductase chain 5
MMIGLGTDFWGNSIFVLPENMNNIDAEFIPQYIKLLPVVLSLGGVVSSFLLYTYGKKVLFQLKISNLGRKLYIFLNRKWFFDKIYNISISQFLLNLSHRLIYKTIDKGIVEYLGPRGLNQLVRLISSFLSNFQKSGNFFRLALFIIVGLIVLILIFFVLDSPYINYYFLFIAIIFINLKSKI